MVNYVAVLVTAVVGYVIGMLWYSPILFGNKWMDYMGYKKKDMEKMKKQGMAKSYIIMFISLLVMSYVLSMFTALSGAVTFGAGAVTGFWIWLGFLATTMLGVVLWQNKPWGLYFINVSHYLVALVVMGGILSVWV